MQAREQSWDAAALEAKLARLPPSQPCMRCPSRDPGGELRMIAPQLGQLPLASGEVDAALFSCPFCGLKWGEPLG